ncbi:MAG: rRNA pseudouridine synthase [Bacteroidia bacterium]|nr:rRNA pseudouridine synthase [Bacteroidia bacterium]
MRKTNNSRSGASSKGKSFKTKDANKAFKKPFGKSSYNDKPKREGDSFSDKDERPKKRFNSSEERTSYKKSEGSDKKYGDKAKRSFGNSDERKPFKKSYGGDKDFGFSDKPKRNFERSGEKKPYKKDFGDKPKRSFDNSEERKPFKKESKFGDKPRKSFAGSDDRKPFKKEFGDKKKDFGFKKPERKFDSPKFEKDGKKPHRKSSRSFNEDSDKTKRVKFDEFEDGKTFSNASKVDGDKKKFKKPDLVKKTASADGLTRLNKYLSNAGIASRRDADVLIQSGVVKVNGVVIDQLGFKIKAGDVVTYGDAAVKSERKVYLLLNKPKDYITTVDDPQERKTVMELIKGACRERLYPVGRLDRNTTGLLLFTNDGEITTKLTHPKYGVKKVYHVSLNKGLKTEDFTAITEGVELEDGIVKADDLAFVGEGKKEIGIEIHSGRNRIVRRLFEHLGYDVVKLDRVVFAGLTKKDLPRGKHRFLTAKEIGFLQMIG